MIMVKIYVTLFWIILVFMFIFAPAAKSNEIDAITAIIYGEQTNPKATNALLNTYYSSRKPYHSLLTTLQKNSCAYKHKSLQYTKASTQRLNKYEKKVYEKIKKQVKKFKPNRKWIYVKHESLSFYKNKAAMIAALKKKWGNEVDYSKAKLIEGQHYFPKRS